MCEFPQGPQKAEYDFLAGVQVPVDHLMCHLPRTPCPGSHVHQLTSPTLGGTLSLDRDTSNGQYMDCDALTSFPNTPGPFYLDFTPESLLPAVIFYYNSLWDPIVGSGSE